MVDKIDDIYLRPVIWVGDSKKQLLKMPKEVQKTMGFQLQAAQKGDKPGLAKPFKNVGRGVWEIRKDFDTDTYRTLYAVQIGQNIYVLHAFQKKSKKGIATPKQETDLIKRRYKAALEHEKETKE